MQIDKLSALVLAGALILWFLGYRWTDKGRHLDDDGLDHRCGRLLGDVGEAALAEMTNSRDQPAERPTSFVSQRGLALTVYILYLIGYVNGVTALVGVIIAHVKAPSSDEVLRSHYRFQIRTFWIGLLYLVVGWPLAYVLIGIPVLVWWLIWSIIRIIKGMVVLNDGRPIARPKSWLFG